MINGMTEEEILEKALIGNELWNSDEIDEVISNTVSELIDEGVERPKWKQIKKRLKEKAPDSVYIYNRRELTKTNLAKLKREGGLTYNNKNRNPPDGAIIYALECIRKYNREIFYYIGSTQQDIEKRLSIHKYNGGDFISPKDINGYDIFQPGIETDMEIDLLYHMEIDRPDELSDKEFEYMILYLEKIISNKVAIELENPRVLGGH